MTDFVHLHVHTEYSLLDGTARIKKLIKTVKEMGMKAVAMTDHGNMYGTIALYDECKSQGIKPIFGTEFYVCDDLTVKTGKPKLSHLILLVKNESGYKNLCMLNTIAFRDGFYYKPRIDYQTLSKYSEGLVCLSACLAGDLPRLLVQNRYDDAKAFALKLKNMFADGDFYVEVQDHGIMEEKLIYPSLCKIAKEIGVKTVATNDVHYIFEEDWEMQDVLMCVQMGKTIDDPDRLKFQGHEFYLKSGEQMQDLFPENEECIKTTLEIAEKCNFTFENVIDKNIYHFPPYQAPDGMTLEEYFRKLIEEGLIKRYKVVTPKIRERVEKELKVINGQGFTQYFLTVWDYINAAKKMGVPVGPGRGSGAGSVVAYAIGITNIDPFKFDLIFERFLHTERVTAPDFDVDFADDRRGDVIEYVKNKYGEDKVVKIVTFGTMAAKNAVKDVGRVLGVPYSELDKVTKIIPPLPAKHNDVLKKAFGFYKAKEGDKDFGVDYSVPDLVDMYNSNPNIKRVVDIAMKIEGMPRQCSTHACGVVIGFDTLEKHMPLSRNGEDITTQYSMVDIERLGHLKMDFLGLRNLNDIVKACEYIKQNHGVELNFDEMSYDDPAVYQLISTGNTKAIFQIESAGFQKFMRELRPTSIEDITAGVSLYRPGPMASIPRYVHNKHNPQDVVYDDPVLEPILNVTYGCIVYQEQVMRIVQDMAGYTLGQADMVRRMMGKKKVDAMAKEKQTFLFGKPAENGKPAIDGAIKRGIKQEVAEKVWGEMESFAQYAFNKSHAAAYSVITYETAYLKTYYEPEFLCAVLNNRITNSDEIKNYVQYAKSEGITVLPPDINKSLTGFHTDGTKTMRFGLAALKNVGVGVIDSIVKEREEHGDYTDIGNFIKRVDSQALNKRCIESLILSGAFDCFGKKRSQLMQVYELLVNKSMNDRKSRASGQCSLFDNLFQTGIADSFDEKINYPDIKEFSKDTLLKLEKSVVGIYISGHPLDSFAEEFSNLTFTSDMIGEEESDEEKSQGINIDDENDVENVLSFENGQNVVTAGIIVELKKIVTKASNKEMAFMTVEDLYGTFEVAVFPNVYQKYKELLAEDAIVKITGKISIRDGKEISILADSFRLLDNSENNEEKAKINENKPKKLYLKFDFKDKELYNKVNKALSFYPGETDVIVVMPDKSDKCVLKNKKIDVTEALMFELCGMFGEENVKYC